MNKTYYSTKTTHLLEALTREHPGIKMTVGFLQESNMIFDAWDSDFQPISPLLTYDVGSITKLFTASLLAKNIYSGHVDLDAMLNHYIPDLPNRYYPTLMQLATHSSGYPSEIPFSKLESWKMMLKMNQPDGLIHKNPYHGTLTKEKMMEELKAHVIQPKQYTFAYNNFAYGVLGYILGQQTNQTAYEAINDFAKNDMDLQTTHIDIPVEIPGFDRKQQPTKRWAWDKEDIVSAAGSLVSTADNLLRFGHAHLCNTKDYLALTHQKYTDGNKKWAMGLGWRIDKDHKHVHWHDGNAGGFSCILLIDMEANTAVCLMTNYGLLQLKEVGFSLLEDAKDPKLHRIFLQNPIKL